MDNKTTIAQIDIEINNLYNQKKQIDEKIKELKQQKGELKTGLEAGQKILFNGKKGIIDELFSYGQYKVRLYKKDGNLSANTRYVYSSDNVEIIQE
jgi:hypothetical protein